MVALMEYWLQPKYATNSFLKQRHRLPSSFANTIPKIVAITASVVMDSKNPLDILHSRPGGSPTGRMGIYNQYASNFSQVVKQCRLSTVTHSFFR